MRQTLALLSSLMIYITAQAQRSFELLQDSTFWLTARNPAALTSMPSRNISEAEVYYSHSGGAIQGNLQGKKNDIFGAEVKSYTRLGAAIVASGSISYNNNSLTEVAGSMLLPTTELMPFDLLEATDENAGSKRIEEFKVAGAVGWKCVRGLSVGASANFTAAGYAKFKDLRHTNSMMYLDTRAGVFYSFGNQSGIGAAGIYRRRTESITFETFGTTDKTYYTLIDYANNAGITETFGSDGFTDAGHEQPLFSEFIGFALQGGVRYIFATATYQHRTGYYGKRSQYTACHSTNEGDFFSASLRYVLPENKGYLCMLNLHFTSQLLSTFRTNYLKTTSPDNASVIYYEYFDGTKMSDKARNECCLDFTGYWIPRGEIYLWQAKAAVSYLWQKQSAYLFPDVYTERISPILLNVSGKRNLIFSNGPLIWIGLNLASQIRQYVYFSAGCQAGYEFHIKSGAYRPFISAGYALALSTDSCISHKSRNTIKIAAGITF